MISLSREGVLTVRTFRKDGTATIVRRMHNIEWVEYNGVRQVSAMPVITVDLGEGDYTSEVDYHAPKEPAPLEENIVFNQIEERRKDPEFMARLNARIEQDKAILDKLAKY